MTQNPQRNIAKLARRRVLVVITARTRGEGLRIPLGGLLLMQSGTKESNWCASDEVQGKSQDIMPVATGACFGEATIIRRRAPPPARYLQSIECDTRHTATFFYVRMPPECVHDAGY